MKLFEKGKIGNVTIKNRVGMAPMGTGSDAAGRYMPSTIAYFRERALGGFGLIITGLNSCSEKYETRPRNLLEKPFHAVALSELVDKVHYAGAKIFVQIGPGLGRLAFTDPDRLPYSCSANQMFYYPDKKCHVFSKEDIAYLVERMANTAGLAKATGADGVELHGYGGYLMDQFHSSHWNTRTDEYGGSLENRLRFSKEIIEAIRKKCGPDFVICMKYTACHDMEGMRELSEGVEMAKIFEKAGVDCLHVDCGNYDRWFRQISTVYEEEGNQLYAARAIKAAGVKIPLLAQGKLFDPKVAEQVLQDGDADFILLGHQSLADAFWPKKVKEGRLLDIRPCIGCNECLYSSFSHRDKTCAVNVACYHEDEYKLTKSDEQKRILVVGAGPGGMNTALSAAQRGFDVEIWEKTDHVGGMLNAAGAPKFKKDVMRLVKYLERQLMKHGVQVQLLKEATPENVLAGGFDHVIISCGATSIIPPIPGVDGENVYNSIDALVAEQPIGKNIVVIGAGLVGVEAAVHFDQYADKVTLIEMLDGVLMTAKHSRNNDQELREMLDQSDVDVIVSAKVTKITKDSVTYEKDGKEATVPCDAVVISAGFKPLCSLADELDGKVDLTVIGDAVQARKIYDAIHEGYHAIRLLDYAE